MKYDRKNIFFFNGIGGIGMSALARYLKQKEYRVYGYDRTENERTRQLEKEGFQIIYYDDPKRLPDELKTNSQNTLVVYTPAIPQSQEIQQFFLNQGFELIKRAALLAEICNEKYLIAVAGTHGKTSTSALIIHMLKTAGIPAEAFLGGISTNYQTNYISPTNDSSATISVVEADEYDRSFLQLKPDVAIVTSVDSDHLDIYVNQKGIHEAFEQFLYNLKDDGYSLVESRAKKQIAINEPSYSYGTDKSAHFAAKNIRIEDQSYFFDFFENDKFISKFKQGVAGDHYTLNSVAAIAACKPLIRNIEYLKKGLASFKGVKRRFEKVFEKENFILYDDYAHHPTEIEYTLKTIRKLHPAEKLTCIFQPHLYSRTRDYQDEFARVLSEVDSLLLLPIYPAREEPLAGVNSGIIADKISKTEVKLVDKSQLLDKLQDEKTGIWLILGAGDIDELIEPITQLKEKEVMS